MSYVPEELRYTLEHAWVRADEHGILTVGVSDFAQNALNDVVFAQLPNVGANVAAGESVCLLESVKSASDVYAPVAGEIIAINTELALSPELINQEPYGAGWLFQIRPHQTDDVNNLLDAATYQSSI